MRESEIRLGEWRLWEQVGLRGAGFPADEVTRLAPDGLAEAADAFGPREQLAGPRWKEFEASFDDAAVKTATVLQEIAATSSFRTAVAWQNRPVPTFPETSVSIAANPSTIQWRIHSSRSDCGTFHACSK